jgi:hypothetical protein
MFKYRFIGLDFNLLTGMVLRSADDDERRQPSLNLIRVFFPELYTLSVLKCKNKHWKLSAHNIEGLYLSLCNKIGFDYYKANILISELSTTFSVSEHLKFDGILNTEIEFSRCSIGYEKDLLNSYLSEYISLRNKSVMLLRENHINQHNLAFGSFIDTTKNFIKLLY